MQKVAEIYVKSMDEPEEKKTYAEAVKDLELRSPRGEECRDMINTLSALGAEKNEIIQAVFGYWGFYKSRH